MHQKALQNHTGRVRNQNLRWVASNWAIWAIKNLEFSRRLRSRESQVKADAKKAPEAPRARSGRNIYITRERWPPTHNTISKTRHTPPSKIIIIFYSMTCYNDYHECACKNLTMKTRIWETTAWTKGSMFHCECALKSFNTRKNNDDAMKHAISGTAFFPFNNCVLRRTFALKQPWWPARDLRVYHFFLNWIKVSRNLCNVWRLVMKNRCICESFALSITPSHNVIALDLITVYLINFSTTLKHIRVVWAVDSQCWCKTTNKMKEKAFMHNMVNLSSPMRLEFFFDSYKHTCKDSRGILLSILSLLSCYLANVTLIIVKKHVQGHSNDSCVRYSFTFRGNNVRSIVVWIFIPFIAVIVFLCDLRDYTDRIQSFYAYRGNLIVPLRLFALILTSFHILPHFSMVCMLFDEGLLKISWWLLREHGSVTKGAYLRTNNSIFWCDCGLKSFSCMFESLWRGNGLDWDLKCMHSKIFVTFECHQLTIHTWDVILRIIFQSNMYNIMQRHQRISVFRLCGIFDRFYECILIWMWKRLELMPYSSIFGKHSSIWSNMRCRHVAMASIDAQIQCENV